jgi:eukaryotic-like serine/threonine-protein kinase
MNNPRHVPPARGADSDEATVADLGSVEVSPTILAHGAAPPPRSIAFARTVPPPLPGNPARRARPPVPAASPAHTSGNSAPPTPMSHSGANTPMSGPSYLGDLELPKPGARINQYEIIRELGRGGMGAVYLARDTKLGRRAAIKFLQTGQPELTTRFLLEARATAQFNHENIVVIYETGEYGGHPFMVLEYLQGSPLTDLLRKGKKMPPTRAIELIVPVVRALKVAHAHNIVHRDLKPDNIFITDAGTVKVLDFGIAKLLEGHEAQPRAGDIARHASLQNIPTMTADTGQISTGVTGTDSSELTRQGAIMGTIPYMSPEQWGIAEADHRTDLWAIGIILFRAVAGRHPLHPLRGEQLIVTAILDQPMPRAREACPDIPPDIAEIIDRCLVKHKEQRIGSADELLRLLEPLLPGRYARHWNTDESPYAGLSAFQEADADRFFGRNREIAAVASRLRDQALLGVIGPSGVGKSSFVRAGVVPALKQSGETWETLVVRPGRQPMAALANAIAPLLGRSGTNTGGDSGGNTSRSTDQTTLASDLSEVEAVLQRLKREPGFLGTVLRSRARRKSTRILLFVDQFEELYTLVPDAPERLLFTSCLSGVADDATSPLRVALSVRSDFLDRVAEDPHFMTELTQGLFFLTPPSRAGLREALTMPAEMAGYRFESSAMVEHMLDHLDNIPGALPLLQFAATKLWEARDVSRKMLTEHSYHSIGGIAGALATHAESVLNELAPQAQGLVQAIFLRMVTPERTRAIVSVEELCELSQDAGEVRRLVNHLVQARLLVTQTGDVGGGASVEIVHESLLHSWPRLRRWLDENQDDAAFLEQLRTAAKQWQARGYPGGLLWRGEAMEEARRWYRRYRGELPELQRAYLKEVFALARRTARNKRALLAGVIGTLSLMVAAAAVALVLIRDAHKKAVIAEKQATAETDRAVIAEKKARNAEQQAKKNLDDLTKTMAERDKAETDKKAAEGEVVAAYEVLKEKNSELEDAMDELAAALKKAKRSRRRARKAKLRAEENEAEALSARAEAVAAQEELEKLLAQQKARIKRLQQQLGSPMVEVLR